MDSPQVSTFIHWLSKASHILPIRESLLKRNATAQIPDKEMQFARIALFSGNPFFWMDAPGDYEHSVAAHKLLKWCMKLPGAHLGLSSKGIGLIVRSIFDRRQRTASVSEDRILDSVGAYQDDAVSWETDDDRFGIHLDQFIQYLNQKDASEGYIWIDPKESEWWPEATFDALNDYQKNTESINQYQQLLNRHRCIFFAPFDINTFSKYLQSSQGANATRYQSLLAKITEAYDQTGIPSPLTVYWSWELLHFTSVTKRLLCQPLLALWSDWPYSAYWAPPRPITYKTAASFSANKAALFLEEVLWKEIETIFGEVSSDCGFSRKSITSFADRKIYAPLFYFAAPTILPENPDDYVNKRSLNIHPLAETCLGSQDHLSSQLAWGILEGNLVVLRRELDDTYNAYFESLYQLLPVNPGSATSKEIDREIDTTLAATVHELISEECSIAVRAAKIDKRNSSILEHISLWPGTLDVMNTMIEEAITLFPRLGQSDRQRLFKALEHLHVLVRRLQILIEHMVAEENEMRDTFSAYIDSAEDRVLHMTLSSLSYPGVHNLHDALLDPYPYHYLKEPLQNLHSQMDLLLRRSERISALLDTVLTEVARNTSEHKEQWIPRLGILFTFLALLIGLPTFIPQTQLTPDTYKGLERYLPLANIIVASRWLVMSVTMVVLLTLIFYILTWLRQYLSEPQDEVQRFLKLVEQANNATGSTSDRSKLEELDEKAVQALTAIWDQHKHEPSKRKFFHWIRRPFQSEDCTKLLQEIWYFRDIVNLFVLLPETSETIPLHRTMCILRYKMLVSGESLISYQYFRDSLRGTGFKDDDIARLNDWLAEEKNQRRIDQLNIPTFATILKARGVTATSQQRMTAKWHGPLDAEQEYFDLGELLVEQEKYKEAISAYQEAIKLNPKESAYYNGLGGAYDGLDKHREAIEAYKKAIQLAQDLPYWHNNLASVYVAQGKPTEAKQEFQRRIELRPDNALAANVALGIILIHEGQYEAGIEHLQQAVKIYWEQANKQSLMPRPEYRTDYLLAHIGMGNKWAISDYREAVQSKQITLASLKADLFYAELLASAPNPPPEIEQVVAILRERCKL